MVRQNTYLLLKERQYKKIIGGRIEILRLKEQYYNFKIINQLIINNL